MTLKKVWFLSRTGRFLSCYEIVKLKNSAFCIKKRYRAPKKARCTVDWRSIRDLNSGGATNALSHFEFFGIYRNWRYLSEKSGSCRKMIRPTYDEKCWKKKSFLTSERRNSNPFRNAEFSGKMREKQAFLARWRDVGEKNRREQKSSIFLIIIGVYVNALIKIYAKILLPQKSNRPYLLLIISNSGRWLWKQYPPNVTGRTLFL